MIYGIIAAIKYWIFWDKTVKNVSPIKDIINIPENMAYITNANSLPSSELLNK